MKLEHYKFQLPKVNIPVSDSKYSLANNDPTKLSK